LFYLKKQKKKENKRKKEKKKKKKKSKARQAKYKTEILDFCVFARCLLILFVFHSVVIAACFLLKR